MHFTEFSVPASLAELPGLHATLNDRAMELGMPADERMRLQLLVEELFINTVRHGLQGGEPSRIVVRLGKPPGHAWHLSYSDQAPAFDPFASPARDASSGEVGGLGIGLIRGMCRRCGYTRQGDRNVIELDF